MLYTVNTFITDEVSLVKQFFLSISKEPKYTDQKAKKYARDKGRPEYRPLIPSFFIKY